MRKPEIPPKTGLKILYHLNDVRVRFPPAVLVTKQKSLIVNTFNGFFMPMSNKRVTKTLNPFIYRIKPTVNLFHNSIHKVSRKLFVVHHFGK